jgi:sulfur relay (sulfurtransferase) complex TusBCD TusD component (DsrE family)
MPMLQGVNPPYGTERNYNALRLAISLTKSGSDAVTVFLMR